jgi:hypothetical protein
MSIFDSESAMLKFKSLSGLGMDTTSDSVSGYILEKKIMSQLKTLSKEVIINEKQYDHNTSDYEKVDVKYYIIDTIYGKLDIFKMLYKIQKTEPNKLKILYGILLEEGVDKFTIRLYPPKKKKND